METSDPSRLTSPSLLAGVLARDDDAWKRFVTVYGPLVFQWIRQARINSFAEEDIAQDVFVAIASSFDHYHHDNEHGGSLRRWMWGITRNKIADWQRRDVKEVAAPGGTTAHVRIQQLPEHPFEQSDPSTEQTTRMELAARAIAVLKTDFEETTWQAFWRSTINGETTADVAADLGTTTKAIRQARYRVLRRLRDELGNDLPASW